MASFHNLPLGIHLKLATYLNVQDNIAVSQSCPAVRNLYRNASFKNTYVTGYEKPDARMLIRTGNLGYTIRAVPFYVFTDPQNYSWFERRAVIRLIIGPESDSCWQQVIDQTVGDSNYQHLQRVEFNFTLSAREIEKAIVPSDTNLFKANLLFPAHYAHFFPSGCSVPPYHIVESIYFSLSHPTVYTPTSQPFENLKLLVVRKMPVAYYEDLVRRINETDECRNLKLYVTYHWVNFSQGPVTVDPTIYYLAKLKPIFRCHVEFFPSNNSEGSVITTPIHLPQVTSIAFSTKTSKDAQNDDILKDPNIISSFLNSLRLPSLKTVESHCILFLDDFTFDSTILNNITKLVFSPRIISRYIFKNLPTTFKNCKSLRELHFNVSSPQLNVGSKFIHFFGEMMMEIFHDYINHQNITTEYVAQKAQSKLSTHTTVNKNLIEIISEIVFHPLSTRNLKCDSSIVPLSVQDALDEFRLYEYIFLHLVLLPRLEYLSLDYYRDTYPSLQLYYLLPRLKPIKQVFIRSSNNDWNKAPVPWIITTLPFQELFPVETYRRYYPRDSGVCSYVIDLEQRKKYEPSLATAALNNIPPDEYLMRKFISWTNSISWAHPYSDDMIEEFQGWL